jgi:ABC-type nitrate/sulfonate/bicarbonate transport system substrate-binding protein
MQKTYGAILIICAALLGSSGCSGTGGGDSSQPASSKSRPVFSLAWSEYPSWSVFGVAHEKGLINGEAGKLGPLEEKWNVDIVLKEADYVPCITMYNTGACDAVCITNMDVLNPASGRDSVAVMPTSTSVGADACLVVGIKDVKDLRPHKVYGLAKSVSEYAFARNLELQGEKESDYQFVDKEPGAAALAMQTNQAGYDAIMVWNPYVLQTLKINPKSRRLFDSSTIPEEIIDMVVIAKSSLAKPGGREFACAVIDTYYEMNRLLADPKTGDDTLVALGRKFSSLGLDEMKQVVNETRFYKTPDAALKLFTGAEFPKTMDRVTEFCKSHAIINEKISYGFGRTGEPVQLLFDSSYIQQVRDRK